ncbi:MAG: hypothetical protein PHR77_14575, partial [Kiritimatiellae bacterium]|nr:hypothetical protein [Kiritimatiellia bacterium]
SSQNLQSAWKLLGWLLAYAVAMGLLEAICVIYLRRLVMPEGMNAQQIGAPLARCPIEIIREACTLVMLVAVSWLSGSNWRSRLACFFFMFGVWDILYYAGLKWLGNWPSSWLEWDCLFLIPKPWYGPVLAPVLISLYFMFACTVVLIYEQRPLPLRMTPLVIVLQVAAFVVWYWSFVKDANHIAKHGYADIHYSWMLFIAGLVCGLTSLWLAMQVDKKQQVA